MESEYPQRQDYSPKYQYNFMYSMYSISILFCNNPAWLPKQMPKFFDHEVARNSLNVLNRANSFQTHHHLEVGIMFHREDCGP